MPTSATVPHRAAHRRLQLRCAARAADAGGVYARTPGSNLVGGHVIKLLGWGEEAGVKFWIGQNSWGLGPGASHPGWGEGGYFRILRGQNECAIEQRVSALLAK